MHFYALFALPYGDPGSIQGIKLGYMLFLGLFILPVAFGLFTLGPRYISSAETGLILLLEAVLGPLWVWLVLSEVPRQGAVLGGVVVIVALVYNALAGSRAAKARSTAHDIPPPPKIPPRAL